MTVLAVEVWRAENNGKRYLGGTLLDYTRVDRGHMTDEHPTSSYGLPVYVSEDGRVYGPHEMPSGELRVTPCGLPCSELDRLGAWVRSAGYQTTGF